MDKQVFYKNKKESVWRGKHKTLRDFYLSGGLVDSNGHREYDTQYYSLDKHEIEIDPDEPFENIEQYSEIRRQKEFIKCCNSFAYFCHKYVKILHPMRGLIPFVLYKYQRKVIQDYTDHRFNIISKFRQGGLTTVTLLWGLWRSMFQLDQNIVLLSKTDRDATDIGTMVDRACENLPLWLKPKKDGKWNDHLKEFKETGSSIKFHSPEAARGKSPTFLIIDEAAFIPDMDKHWKAMFPSISTGGSCALVSTVNGLGNWYEQTYHDAKSKNNMFNVIDLDFWEHPDYNNANWIKLQKSQLGEKGYLQEILREFLGSGETYFPSSVITRLTEQTRNNAPSRKCFAQWVNKNDRMAELEGELDKGAMWVWKEPIEGHEYILSADCAEGQAENNDNSCFEIIDTSTLEQVAEFYSNTIVPHEFAQVLNEVGIYYNNALMVVENMGPGGAVISSLQHNLFYENLYYESSKAIAKPGVKMNQTNRPLYLESLQNRLLNQTVRINSARLVMEFNTFEYNAVSKKAMARKGKHDDAIMAMAIALYIRDTMLRDMPLGAEVPKEISSVLKLQVYEEIKRELMEGRPEDLFIEDEDLLSYDNELVFPRTERRNNSLLKEFNW